MGFSRIFAKMQNLAFATEDIFMKLLTKILLLGITMAVTVNSNANIPVDANKGSLSPMIKEIMPAMVAISGIKRIEAPQPNHIPLYSDQSQNQPEQQIGYMIGSGVIVDAQKGLILTNAHVIAEMEEVEVLLHDKRKYDAKILGKDKESDIGLLQIDASDLKAIEFADSDDVEVGDFVVAVGNPFGFNQTVTFGIVSALGRTDLGLSGYYDFIQTDASINHGNSGGGLTDTKGRLIGINTALLTPANAGNIGLGFAIPSNMARSIMNQLAESGYVDRGPLGVTPQALSPDLAKAFGLDSTKGAIIIDLLHNSPAQVAGLTVGDVIIAVNGKEVKSPAHLRTMISIIPIGSIIKLKVVRDKKIKEIEIKLTSLKDNYVDGKTIFSGLDGVYLDESTPRDAPYVGIKVMEIHPQSIASNTELEPGDIIIAANKNKTTSLKQLSKAANENPDILLMQVARDGINFFVAIPATTK